MLGSDSQVCQSLQQFRFIVHLQQSGNQASNLPFALSGIGRPASASMLVENLHLNWRGGFSNSRALSFDRTGYSGVGTKQKSKTPRGGTTLHFGIKPSKIKGATGWPRPHQSRLYFFTD
jgi:hypothetical protein